MQHDQTRVRAAFPSDGRTSQLEHSCCHSLPAMQLALARTDMTVPVQDAHGRTSRVKIKSLADTVQRPTKVRLSSARRLCDPVVLLLLDVLLERAGCLQLTDLCIDRLNTYCLCRARPTGASPVWSSSSSTPRSSLPVRPASFWLPWLLFAAAHF